MPKKKTNLIMGYLMIAMVVIVYLAVSPENKVNPDSTFDMVMELLEYGEYPEDPYTLIETNNKFLACLYGGAVLDEEIEPVLIRQRLLFSDEILAINPLETHLERTLEQVSGYREKDIYIETTTIESIEYDKTDKNICYITIRQHTNNNKNNATLFYAASIDGVWKIIGWEAVREEE